jgi:hypothetical protein
MLLLLSSIKLSSRFDAGQGCPNVNIGKTELSKGYINGLLADDRLTLGQP